MCNFSPLLWILFLWWALFDWFWSLSDYLWVQFENRLIAFVWLIWWGIDCVWFWIWIVRWIILLILFIILIVFTSMLWNGLFSVCLVILGFSWSCKNLSFVDFLLDFDHWILQIVSDVFNHCISCLDVFGVHVQEFCVFFCKMGKEIWDGFSCTCGQCSL